MKNELLFELETRGFINQTSNLDGLNDALNAGKISAYFGADPTADSLHVGHIVPVLMMRWFQRHGHRPIMLVGGATGRIGDPSGRDSARPMLSDEDIKRNSEGLQRSYSKFIKFGNGPSDAIMADNYDWMKSIPHMEFLRNFGPDFTVPRMLSMESVKKRLENGMSLLEFEYMTLQAVDFLELFKKYGCILQLCGSDQWGNSIMGIELIRKKLAKEAFVMSTSLITDSSGRKIGKSENNAAWVDERKTPPFEFFQYFRNTPDDLVDKFLKIYTDIPLPEIAKLYGLQGAELNDAKKILAFEATKITHGEAAAREAAEAADAMFGGGAAASGVPKVRVNAKLPMGALDFAMLSGLFASKSEARRTIEQGGLSIDGVRVSGPDIVVLPAASLLVQKGKKT
ncbi:MAG: tyrosine--tRNA ligase, partial [Rickettsiales bacterium]|nr:tyrosine--tRNA ligase [Rickettsiales bacterium]